MPEWRSPEALADHFRRHGREVGARNLAEYARLATATIRAGVRFTYRLTGKARIGYDHRGSGSFVVMDDAGSILSLSRRSENYVRTQAGSTYGR